jgi:hypothetical protein
VENPGDHSGDLREEENSMRGKSLLVTLVALALLVGAVGATVVLAQPEPGTIYGVVFCDANLNWTLDPGEGMDGIAVTLWDDTDCNLVPDSVRATQDTAGGGSYAFTGLPFGATNPPGCYVVAADTNDPDLGACDLGVMSRFWPWLSEQLPTLEVNPMFIQMWDKTVDGVPWVPGMEVTAETSDTIEIVDTVALPRLGREANNGAQQQLELTLVETWNPSELDLVDVEWEPGTTVIQASGTLTWVIPIFGLQVPTATLTKTLHVEPCTWLSTLLEEGLFVPQGIIGPLRQEQQIPILERPVIINKTLPDLWIDSTGGGEVSPGDQPGFVLSYGNDGGYENGVWIRNEFPPEAPFASAVPVPDREAADGSWVEWDVGDLANGAQGSIDVSVDIQEGLQPSTTMVITDWIYNHVEEAVDLTEITFHIEQPPLDLGDRVWYDTDQDGIQDAGEPGVASVVVDLYVRACTGQAIASDTTNGSGHYLFADLGPGIYCLQFRDIPAGMSISPQNQGSDDALDSDADPATAQIADIDLQATDLDEDMGLYQPPLPQAPVVPEPSTLVLLGGAVAGLAVYAGLQFRARRRR